MRSILSSVLVLTFISTTPLFAASQDDSIEWNGISHIPWQDRRPLCPLSNEAFTVHFKSYRNDLSNARIFLDEGGSTSWHTATVISQRGPYSIWEASLPATSSDTINYYIELIDGTDTDYISVSGMSDGTPSDGGWELDFATLAHAPYGATLASGGAVFRVWAPGASTCHVRGSFNSWGLGDPMTRMGDDFVAFVSSVAAGHQYKYFFGPGDIWKPDACARALNAADNYNSIVVDPLAYTWVEDDFDTPDFEEMKVYQLHVGTFAGRNDPYGAVSHPAGFAEVAARVSHLVELGINAVMLNPITEFPTDESGGYNPISTWAPEWAYGTPDELRNMVDVLHQNGIAVIIDVLWNHFSFSDNYLWYYDGTQFYFDLPDAVETPWGAQADFGSAGVREYYVNSALQWFEEYRIDGFRMDATSYMDTQTGGWGLMQELNDMIDNRYADKIMVAEQLPDNDWVTRPTSLGGAGFDSQYYDWFTDELRREIFDAATGDPEMWRIRDIINGGGTYLSGTKVFNYIELHDEAWGMSGGQRIVKSIDTSAPHDDEWARGRVKLAQGLITMAPGIPAFLMGLDWLEDTDFGSSSSDRIDWSKKTTYSDHFAYFKDLLTLRGEAGLRSDASRNVHHVNESGNVLAFRRWNASGDFVIVANFSNSGYSGYRVGIPQNGDWFETLNSQDPVYGGSGPVNGGTLIPEAIPYNGYSYSITLDLAAMALVVLQSGTQTSAGDDPFIPVLTRLEPNYPNPFNPSTNIRFSLPAGGHARLRIFDVSGRLVRTLFDKPLEAGIHTEIWDGKNAEGDAVASGVYFCRLDAGDVSRTRTMVLLR